MTSENNELKQSFHTLDKAVTNTLAIVHLDGNHETIESGMMELQQRLTSQESQIDVLEEDNHHLKVTVEDLKSKLSIMTLDNIDLRGMNKAMEEKLEAQHISLSADVSGLQAALQEEQENMAKQKKKTEAAEAMYRKNIVMLESEISSISDQLLTTAKELDSKSKERDKARSELAAVNERTRKLLFKLDMTKDTRADATLALDHARNIMYARRRTSRLAPVVPPVDHENSTDRSEENTEKGKQNFVGAQSRSSEGSSSMSTPRRGSTSNRRSSNGSHNGLMIGNGKTFNHNEPLLEHSEEKSSEHTMTCLVCDKTFQEVSNFDGACIFHLSDAIKLNAGTELEVWSCCKSIDTYKGCQKARHVAAEN